MPRRRPSVATPARVNARAHPRTRSPKAAASAKGLSAPGAGMDAPRPGERMVAAVLAGGLSTRMGQDKARLKLGQRSLLNHARAAAAAAGLRTMVVRKDRIARCGPLGGIHAALASGRADVVLFLACDMPFVPVRLLERLRRALRPRDGAVFATVGRTVGFPFLLRAAAAGQVKAQILKGELSLQGLARSLKARRLAVAASELPGLLNINTPDELATARRQAPVRPRTPRTVRAR